MYRLPVNSSNISSIGYDDNILEIEFSSGKVYQYQGVPYSVYSNLMSAGSHGSFFANHIKNVYQGFPLN